jgi:hypothetical protein
MEHRVLLLAGFGDGFEIAQVRLVLDNIWRQAGIPAASQHRDAMAHLMQSAGEVTSQKSAASGNQNIHKTIIR